MKSCVDSWARDVRDVIIAIMVVVSLALSRSF